MEGILGAAAVRGRVGQRADGVEQLDDGAGPAVRHDQRQRVLVLGLDVDEVDLHAVDLGRELRQRVQLRLGLAPVVLGRPVARERLKRRRLHTLRCGRRRAPCWASASRSMRRRNSASCSSGISTWKGRMSMAVSTVVLMRTSVVGAGRGAMTSARVGSTSPNVLPPSPLSNTSYDSNRTRFARSVNETSR